MFNRIPLTALRTFEAAARLGSFKAAADELSVTASAVSFQIKALENWLGALLFHRSNQGVILTTAGDNLHSFTHRFFLDLRNSLETIRPITDSHILTVTMPPAFAALWLIPKIRLFYQAHPEIDIRIVTSNEIIDLNRNANIDIAIRCVFREDPSTYQLDLMHENFGAYSSSANFIPDAVERRELITFPRDARFSVPVDWKTWCAVAKHEEWLNQSTLRLYDDEHFALQAAISGHGLVLASDVLSADYVKKGLLTPYMPEVKLAGARYVAACIPGRERYSRVKQFLNWLYEETSDRL